MGCGSSKKESGSDLPQRKLPSSAHISQSSASFGQPLQSSSRGPSAAAAAVGGGGGQPLQSSPQQIPGILPSSEQKLQPFPKTQPKPSQRVSPPAGEPVRLLPHGSHSAGPRTLSAAHIFEQLSRF